jgi:hypothetical protein
MTEIPIEDHLDELLRRTRADARTTRRLLDEASDHLYAAAAELEAGGMSQQEAETEAVRRFGPVKPIVRATVRRSLAALVLETLRAALFLAGCGLLAVGISGLVAFAMNLWLGRSFVGGVSVFGFGGASVNETADDAVVLRIIAGLIGLAVLLSYLALRRRTSSPPLLARRAGRRAGRGRLRRRHGRARDRVCRPSRAQRHQRRRLLVERRAGRSSRDGVFLRPRRSRSAAVPLTA